MKLQIRQKLSSLGPPFACRRLLPRRLLGVNRLTFSDRRLHADHRHVGREGRVGHAIRRRVRADAVEMG